MAIIGTHALLYTSEPDAVRALFRDVFGWKHVDAGHGWLIFALPPAELGIHPAEGPTFEGGARHQLSFMCDDIHETIADSAARGSRFGASRRTRATASRRASSFREGWTCCFTNRDTTPPSDRGPRAGAVAAWADTRL
jgi:predicted enzyme related to lactoylglutathione lyase